MNFHDEPRRKPDLTARNLKMASPQYLVYTPRLSNGPISKHKTLGEAALALAANLLIAETGFVIHKNEVVLTFTKPNTLILPPPNVTPTPQPFPFRPYTT